MEGVGLALGLAFLRRRTASATLALTLTLTVQHRLCHPVGRVGQPRELLAVLVGLLVGRGGVVVLHAFERVGVRVSIAACLRGVRVGVRVGVGVGVRVRVGGAARLQRASCSTRPPRASP